METLLTTLYGISDFRLMDIDTERGNKLRSLIKPWRFSGFVESPRGGSRRINLPKPDAPIGHLYHDFVGQSVSDICDFNMNPQLDDFSINEGDESGMVGESAPPTPSKDNDPLLVVVQGSQGAVGVITESGAVARIGINNISSSTESVTQPSPPATGRKKDSRRSRKGTPGMLKDKDKDKDNKDKSKDKDNKDSNKDKDNKDGNKDKDSSNTNVDSYNDNNSNDKS